MPMNPRLLRPTSGAGAATCTHQAVLLLHFDGANNATTSSDSSAVGHTLTFSGNAKISTAQSKWGGSSLFVDGGQVLIPSHPSLNLDGSTPFTVEFWMMQTQAPSNYCTVLARRISSNWQYQMGAGDPNTPYYYFGYDTPNQYVGVVTTETGPYIPLNEWVHVAGCVLNGRCNLFVNGQIAGAGAWFAHPDNNAPLVIGTQENGGNEFFTGYLDDIRITPGVVYCGDFTPPAAPLEASVTVSCCQELVAPTCPPYTGETVSSYCDGNTQILLGNDGLCGLTEVGQINGGDDNPCAPPPCAYGCTNPEACNYDPNATCDDGSCYDIGGNAQLCIPAGWEGALSTVWRYMNPCGEWTSAAYCDVPIGEQGCISDDSFWIDFFNNYCGG